MADFDEIYEEIDEEDERRIIEETFVPPVPDPIVGAAVVGRPHQKEEDEPKLPVFQRRRLVRSLPVRSADHASKGREVFLRVHQVLDVLGRGALIQENQGHRGEDSGDHDEQKVALLPLGLRGLPHAERAEHACREVRDGGDDVTPLREDVVLQVPPQASRERAVVLLLPHRHHQRD